MSLRRTLVPLAVTSLVAASLTAAGGPAVARGGEDTRVFVPGAVVNGDHTVTLPLHQGRVGTRPVWFTVTEASESGAADDWDASRASKLENAVGTDAVVDVSVDRDGTLVFPATVDFAADRVVVPGPTGFPPEQAAPGAVAEPGYSPLVRLPDGAVLNAPHLANDSGEADKAVDLDRARGRVRVELTDGFARDDRVLYISTEASDPGAAALENVTWAPRLDAAPFAGGDGTDSARASLAAVTNGRTGAGNPQRQGLNSALLGDGDPLNVLAWTPNQGRYSPLWDVHLTRWADGRRPVLLTEFADVEDLAEDGVVGGFPTGAWGPSGFVVNCPVIAEL